MLQLATRAFLPGLLMLSGADLDGSLPEGKDWPATPPLWQLSSRPSGRHGLPSGLAMYRLPGNGVEELLERMLASRANCRIATGELIDVPSCGEKSVLITVSRLPDGASLAFFGNFSGGSVTFTPRFSLWMNASSRIDVLSENALPYPDTAQNGSTLGKFDTHDPQLDAKACLPTHTFPPCWNLRKSPKRPALPGAVNPGRCRSLAPTLSPAV